MPTLTLLKERPAYQLYIHVEESELLKKDALKPNIVITMGNILGNNPKVFIFPHNVLEGEKKKSKSVLSIAQSSSFKVEF